MLDFGSNNPVLFSPIVRTDSYKFSQYRQYPPGTKYIRSYIEGRGGKGDILFFGLQAFIKEYLMLPVTQADLDFAERVIGLHGTPFNKDGWQYIIDVHGGRLPIEIEAVAEGTVMAPGDVQVQIVNTDPNCFWLTSYVETALLRAVWYPSTVASASYAMKKAIYDGLVRTSEAADEQIAFKLHDFGARGASSAETAELGGMAHLVNFMGTDTFEGVLSAMKFYNTDVCGYSIPASEHSTITSWGRSGELDAFRNMLEQFPTGLVACVSDSYDLMKAVREYWGTYLKDAILARDGTLVVRPDSGDPVKTPVEVIEALMECFGYTINSKGFKVLPDQVRVIQGDGIGPDELKAIIDLCIERGISLDNIAFGMGGGLLQKVNRDTFKYAMKANEALVVDGWVPVFKDPITDPGKRSKKGRQALVKRDGKFVTIPASEIVKGVHGQEQNYLRPVFRDGVLLIDDTFDAIRARAVV